jgi:hypothetical protein
VFVVIFAAIGIHLITRSRAATTPPNFYGLNWHPVWINSGGQDAEIDLMQQAGVATVRLDVPWYFLEPSQGTYDQTYLTRLDNAVDQLYAHGIDPLVIVTSAPAWVTGAPSGDPNPGNEPPIRTTVGNGCNSTQTNCTPYNGIQAYDNFLSFLIQRWSGKVNKYEIWNEPDGQWSWISTEQNSNTAETDDAIDYTTLLKSAYTAAKTVNPSVTILAGSLSGTGSGPQLFLSTMYEYGAKNYFDVLSQHYYCDPPDHDYCGTSSSDDSPATLANTWTSGIYPIMNENGDSAKPVWVTETGYNSSPGGISEAQQASYLTQTFEAAKSLPNVARVYWYTSDGDDQGGSTDYGDYYGLIEADMHNANSMPAGYRLKPAYAAFQELASVITPTPAPTLAPTVMPTSASPPGHTPNPAPTRTPASTSPVAQSSTHSSQAPNAPTNLRATLVTDTQIALAWNASTGSASGYKLYRDNSLISDQSGTSYVDVNLQANTSYTYVVAAYDSAGQVSAQSPLLTVKTQAISSGGGGVGPAVITLPGTNTPVSLPTSSEPIVRGTICIGTGQRGSEVLKVDGTIVSTNCNLDTIYLTNGQHTVMVDQNGMVSRRVIDVENKLAPWQSIRNTLLEGLHGNKILMNTTVGGILLLLLGLISWSTWIAFRPGLMQSGFSKLARIRKSIKI